LVVVVVTNENAKEDKQSIYHINLLTIIITSTVSFSINVQINT